MWLSFLDDVLEMEEKDVVSNLTCICIVGIEVSQLSLSCTMFQNMDSRILAFEKGCSVLTFWGIITLLESH